MNVNNHLSHSLGIISQLVLVAPFLFAFFFYISAIIISNKHHKPWSIYKTICFILGSFLAIITVAGPFANQAHVDFTAHMIGHLFLGMLAPLLIVLSAPMTLLLRTLSVPLARKLTKILKSWPFGILTNPIIASLLNVGGLWLLYTTSLYSFMHQNIIVYLLVHFHVFLAGYLFTMSIIYIDPVFHRTSFLYRSVIFILALAGHEILSKYIYAYPPIGVSKNEAEVGGMVMYYGGDIIDVIIIFILCLQWFKATRPRIKSTSF